MFQALLAVVLLAFIVTAPLKVSVLTLGSIIVITGIVQVTATKVVRANFTLGEAFKAVALSMLLFGVGVFTTYSFINGGGVSIFGLLSLPIVIVGNYFAYVAGFRIALSVPLLEALVIAIFSTGTSVIYLWGLGRVISLSS